MQQGNDVWVVVGQDIGGGSKIGGVFDSKEAAESFAKQLQKLGIEDHGTLVRVEQAPMFFAPAVGAR